MDYYGLSESSNELFPTHGIVHMNQEQASLTEIISHLEQAYCGPMSVEFCHLEVRNFTTINAFEAWARSLI